MLFDGGMSLSILPEVIERVRERVSLAEIASDLPKFRKSGKGYVACCPFHKDGNPSLSINDEEGLYYCFACGAKGSVFDYVMHAKSLSFPEAVRYLAAKVGVEIEEQSLSPYTKKRQQQTSDNARTLREICNTVANIYKTELTQSARARGAREYLNSRGLTLETQEIFGVGYAPKEWDFVLRAVISRLRAGELPELESKNESELKAHLISLGVIKKRESNTVAPSGEDVTESRVTENRDNSRDCYDAFRDRIMFPISRSDGSVLAFGGRILPGDNSGPKYINCAESPIYRKRKVLFGLHQALESMRKSRHAYLVEGYMDVMSMYQRGFKNTVAACGTAVCEEHVALLKRFVNRLTLVFDGDSAGQSAAVRCYEVFLNSGIELRAVALPNGDDPDVFAKRYTFAQIERAFAKHERPVFELFVDSLIKGDGQQDGFSASAVARGKYAEECAKVVAKVRNPVERECLLRYSAERIGVRSIVLEELVTNMRDSKSGRGVLERKKLRYGSRLDNLGDVGNDASGSRDFLADRSNGSSSNATPRSSDNYWRHVVTALICAPRLAKRMLNMPSMLRALSCDSGLSDTGWLNERAHRFVEILAENDICNGIGDAHDGAQRADCVAFFTSLLNACKLPSSELIQEAIRQSEIGGGQPEKVIQDIDVVTERSMLGKKVEMLRAEEAIATNDERLLAIAQDKLLKRREMQRLS